MKNVYKLFGIIAIAAVIGLSMIACDSSGGGGTGAGISIDKLPEFPSDSIPAETKTDAENILAELRQSSILSRINSEMWEVINENGSNSGNYSFSNRSLPDGFVRVSATDSYNVTYTGGFRTLVANRNAYYDLKNTIDELYNAYPVNYAEIERLSREMDRLDSELFNIQFARGDKGSATMNMNYKWELTRAKTESGVTILQNSIYESKQNMSSNSTITTVGSYTTARFSGTFSEKDQTMRAFTVTTPGGSVKVILDVNIERSTTANNVNFEDDTVGTLTSTEKYSGSLKVYGSNNTLLIDHPIVDEESYDEAQDMIW